MNLPRIVYPMVLLVGFVSVARADYIVSINNTTLTPGSTGFVDVLISSTTGQSLAYTNFEFRITTGGPTRLDFTDSPAAASDPTFSSSSYVFFSNSLDLDNSLQLGTASPSSVPNDTFIGGDATSDGLDVTVPTSNLLLAKLPITTLTALAPAVGDTFTISLVPASATDPVDLSDNTGFFDSAFDFSSFTSTSGVVMIVPEPATWCLLASAGLTGLATFARRRRMRLAVGGLASVRLV